MTYYDVLKSMFLVTVFIGLVAAPIVLVGLMTGHITYYGTGLQIGGVYLDWYYVTHRQ
jgi:hypothetical protein